MDDSLFARLGYDPVRIHAHFYGQPAGAQPRSAGPAMTVEVKCGGPGPAAETSADRPTGVEDEPTGPAEALDDPPRNGGVAEPAPAGTDGGGPPDSAAPAKEPLHQPAAGPPRRSVEDQEEYNLQSWLRDHWDEVKALVAARQAPGEPKPLVPPAPAPKPRDLPRPYVRRGDRWNTPKMVEFLRQLAATHSVSAAARSVGMSRNSAYNLRSRLKGTPFDIAWEAAFRHGYDNLAHAALDRALNGVEVPHYSKGELVGTSRKYDERLTVALLAMRNRAGAPVLGRYNAAAEYWGENWEVLLERVGTGPTGWDQEYREVQALAKNDPSLRELAEDREKKGVDAIIARNAPEEPRGRRR